jgi:hypothetical protein
MSDNLAVLQQTGEFPGQDKAPQVRRKLWDESATKSRLGEEGYAWFVECAERNLPKCPQCNGSGSVTMPDPIGIRRGLLVTTTCPVCSAYVENLTAFTKTYFEVRSYRLLIAASRSAPSSHILNLPFPPSDRQR